MIKNFKRNLILFLVSFIATQNLRAMTLTDNLTNNAANYLKKAVQVVNQNASILSQKMEKGFDKFIHPVLMSNKTLLIGSIPLIIVTLGLTLQLIYLLKKRIEREKIKAKINETLINEKNCLFLLAKQQYVPDDIIDSVQNSLHGTVPSLHKSALIEILRKDKIMEEQMSIFEKKYKNLRFLYKLLWRNRGGPLYSDLGRMTSLSLVLVPTLIYRFKLYPINQELKELREKSKIASEELHKSLIHLWSVFHYDT